MHEIARPTYGRAFAIGIFLNVGFTLLEMLYGFRFHSTALLADAGHNASDVLSLLLAWSAIRLSSRRPAGYTFGLRKSTILASVINGTLILVAAALIAKEAIDRFIEPAAVHGDGVMWVAAIGTVVNAVTALLFMKGRKHDLNIRGSFLHMAADAGVSAGVVLGGWLILSTGKAWIDPAISLLIVLVIIYSAWDLLAESIRLVLDAVPRHVDLPALENYLLSVEGVEEVHDLHVWALSTSETALTAHLVMPGGHDDQFIYRLRDELAHRFHIHHTTLQIEASFGDLEYNPYKK